VPDYSEVQALLQEQAQASQPTADQLAAHLRASRVVAMRFEEIVAGDAWGTFRAHLEAMQKEREGFIAEVNRQFLDLSTLPEKLAALQATGRYHQGWLDALGAVLSLPELVMERDQAIQAGTPA